VEGVDGVQPARRRRAQTLCDDLVRVGADRVEPPLEAAGRPILDQLVAALTAPALLHSPDDATE
jgi:hypothetical protein